MYSHYFVEALCFYKDPDGAVKEIDGFQSYIGVIQEWNIEIKIPEVNMNDIDQMTQKDLLENIEIEKEALKTAPTFPHYDQSKLKCEKLIILCSSNTSNHEYPMNQDLIIDRVSNILITEIPKLQEQNMDDEIHDLAKYIFSEVTELLNKKENKDADL